MEEVKAYSTNPIYAVDLKVSLTSIHHRYIKAFAKRLLHSRNVGELHDNLMTTMEGLHNLNVFKSSNIKVNPGQFEDTASIELALVDRRSWDTTLHFSDDIEGGSTSLAFFVRNLRRKADFTKLSLQYRHNTGTKGFSLEHTDQLFNPGKLIANYRIASLTREIDQNFLEHTSGLEFGIKTFSHKHEVEFGRHVRKNIIAVQYASLGLLEELPNSSKNFCAYTYNFSNVDDEDEPTQGLVFKLRNELAMGDETKFHKSEFKGSYYTPLLDYITLETSLDVGLLFPWAFTKAHTNDKFRCRYLKGFVSAGDRLDPADSKLNGRYNVSGDDIGSQGYASIESKVLFYQTPFIRYAGLTPFLYGNLLIVNPSSLRLTHLQCASRGSVGFGLSWSTIFGKIEFAYASKVWAKPSDVPAEFSVRFSI
mmetsp:Transcript_7891/g.15293  ORF Transcript_7891/g.15293 Transcript_7891/m.15293 type:complete len:422 (+) Transcript_7891:13870-15135(+)